MNQALDSITKKCLKAIIQGCLLHLQIHDLLEDRVAYFQDHQIQPDRLTANKFFAESGRYLRDSRAHLRPRQGDAAIHAGEEASCWERRVCR